VDLSLYFYVFFPFIPFCERGRNKNFLALDIASRARYVLINIGKIQSLTVFIADVVHLNSGGRADTVVRFRYEPVSTDLVRRHQTSVFLVALLD
jgi:hypothetical protein